MPILRLMQDALPGRPHGLTARLHFCEVRILFDGEQDIRCNVMEAFHKSEYSCGCSHKSPTCRPSPYPRIQIIAVGIASPSLYN